MSKTPNSIVQPTFVPRQDDPCPCSLLVESRRTWSNPDMSFHVKDTKLYCGNLTFVHQAILIMFFSIMVTLPRVPPLDVHLKIFVETKLEGGGGAGPSHPKSLILEFGTFWVWDPFGLAWGLALRLGLDNKEIVKLWSWSRSWFSNDQYKECETSTSSFKLHNMNLSERVKQGCWKG